MDGVDFYKDPLQGIVPIKISGREDVGTSEYIIKEKLQRAAWATVIMGCHKISQTHTEIEEIKMNRQQVADRISWMWENAEVDDTAKDFVRMYMADLEEQGQTKYISSISKSSSVWRQLNTHFFENSDRNPVRCRGGATVHVTRTPNTKKAEHLVVAYPDTELDTELN